jgi:DUF4097 and DUF4098 domain-containing protein YvlB
MENKKRIIVWIVLLALTTAVLISFQGCSLFKKKYEKTETREYKFNSSQYQKLSVENPNGDVTIRKSDDDSMITVRAEITKYVTKKELDEPLKGINIEIDSTGNTLRLADVVIKEKSDFKIQFNMHHSTVINYIIYVPSGVNIDVEGTNGKVDLKNFNNDVKVDLTNGNVKVENVYGKIKLDLTNGNISAKLDSTKSLDFETVNGNIKLEVGEKFSGVFDLRTVNGKITRKNVTFESTDDEKKGFKGTLGKGDATVKLETTNGKITIDKN